MLSNVEHNKAPGEDRIPYEFFVNATEEFLPLIATCYNVMYTRGLVDKCNNIFYPQKGKYTQYSKL